MAKRNYNAELISLAMQISWYGGRPQPTLLVGVPGTGKTQFIEGLALELEKILKRKGLLDEDERYETATYVIPQTGPDSLEGIGVPNAEKTELNFLPRAALRRIHNSKFGLVFGDELSSGSDETGAAFMAFSQDGRAGDLQVHTRISRIYAMNPAECAAAGRELSPPEANRFLFIPDWDIPIEDTCDYLRGGPGFLQHVKELPEDWQKFVPKVYSKLADFLERNRELVNQLVPGSGFTDSHVKPKAGEKAVDTTGPWASQRSYENAARLVAAVLSTGEPIDSVLVSRALKGTIGEYCADEFHKFLRENNIPSPAELLASDDPPSLLPKRSDERKSCLEELARYVSGKEARERWGEEAHKANYLKAWDIIGPVLQKRRDDAFSAAKILNDHVPGLAEIPIWIGVFHKINTSVLQEKKAEKK